MYEDVFREVGFRLPFSPFQVSVFEWMELCHSQLYQDSFAYMMAFELVCRFLRLPPIKDLFFAIFVVQRGSDKDDGQSWVSFRQRKVMFEAFTSETTNFQRRFLVRLQIEVVERPHEDVGVVSTRVSRFHFYWSKDHIKHEPDTFRHSYTRMSDRNKRSFARIIEFVSSFSRSEVVAEDGNLVLDSRGNQVTMPRMIDTHSLVLSKDFMSLLGKFGFLLFVSYLSYAFY